MLETLLALILISAVLMIGVRRIKLLTQGFIVQSLSIALICLYFSYKTGESNLLIIAILTILAKVILIPYIINKSIKDLKLTREMDLIINSLWSYILCCVGIVFTYGLLADMDNPFLKAGIVIMLVGAVLIIGRKKAITQMIGFLCMENGLVLFEISIVKMSLIMEAGIILEVLILAVIMGIMIFNINRTFDTVNTDYLSNLNEREG